MVVIINYSCYSTKQKKEKKSLCRLILMFYLKKSLIRDSYIIRSIMQLTFFKVVGTLKKYCRCHLGDHLVHRILARLPLLSRIWIGFPHLVTEAIWYFDIGCFLFWESVTNDNVRFPPRGNVAVGVSFLKYPYPFSMILATIYQAPLVGHPQRPLPTDHWHKQSLTVTVGRPPSLARGIF